MILNFLIRLISMGQHLLDLLRNEKRIVICDPSGRSRLIVWIKVGQPNEEDFLLEFAIKAERTVGWCNFAAADRYRAYREFL